MTSRRVSGRAVLSIDVSTGTASLPAGPSSRSTRSAQWAAFSFFSASVNAGTAAGPASVTACRMRILMAGSASSSNLAKMGTEICGPGRMAIMAWTAWRRTEASESFTSSAKAGTTVLAGAPISPSDRAAWARTSTDLSFNSAASGATALAARSPCDPNSPMAFKRSAASEDFKALVSSATERSAEIAGKLQSRNEPHRTDDTMKYLIFRSAHCRACVGD